MAEASISSELRSRLEAVLESERSALEGILWNDRRNALWALRRYAECRKRGREAAKLRRHLTEARLRRGLRRLAMAKRPDVWFARWRRRAMQTTLRQWHRRVVEKHESGRRWFQVVATRTFRRLGVLTARRREARRLLRNAGLRRQLDAIRILRRCADDRIDSIAALSQAHDHRRRRFLWQWWRRLTPKKKRDVSTQRPFDRWRSVILQKRRRRGDLRNAELVGRTASLRRGLDSLLRWRDASRRRARCRHADAALVSFRVAVALRTWVASIADKRRHSQLLDTVTSFAQTSHERRFLARLGFKVHSRRLLQFATDARNSSLLRRGFRLFRRRLVAVRLIAAVDTIARRSALARGLTKLLNRSKKHLQPKHRPPTNDRQKKPPLRNKTAGSKIQKKRRQTKAVPPPPPKRRMPRREELKQFETRRQRLVLTRCFGGLRRFAAKARDYRTLVELAECARHACARAVKVLVMNAAQKRRRALHYHRRQALATAFRRLATYHRVPLTAAVAKYRHRLLRRSFTLLQANIARRRATKRRTELHPSIFSTPADELIAFYRDDDPQPSVPSFQGTAYRELLKLATTDFDDDDV